MAFGEGLKEYDLFGIPVTLSYKGENEFRSRVGAIVSAVVIIMYCSLTVGALDQLFVHREYQQVLARDYEPYYD